MSKKAQIYGIKNCDTVRKSLKWLAENEIDNDFHDLKVESLSASLIKEWLKHIDKDKLVNKRGLTWRKIPDESKSLETQNDIIKLIQNNPTVVKRPIAFNGKSWSVGFKPENWNTKFLKCK